MVGEKSKSSPAAGSIIFLKPPNVATSSFKLWVLDSRFRGLGV